MKMPFSFGARLIFRMVLPGLLFSIVSIPMYIWVCERTSLLYDPITYIPFSAVAFGWLVLLSDMHIYMLFEGRRYWPEWIRRRSLAHESKRLGNLIQSKETLKEGGNHPAYLEAAIKTTYFPLEKNSGNREAQYPSRLGNIITEFEQYPTIKYGMDGVFYWYRIWIGLPKDLREEIDEHQALVDSSVYISFILYISALVLTLYILLGLLTGSDLFPSIPLWLEICGVPGSLVFGYLIYNASLLAHVQYGHFFKAVFDQHCDDVKLETPLGVIAEKSGKVELKLLKGSDAKMAVWRYLRWHKVILPNENQSRNIEGIGKD